MIKSPVQQTPRMKVLVKKGLIITLSVVLLLSVISLLRGTADQSDDVLDYENLDNQTESINDGNQNDLETELPNQETAVKRILLVANYRTGSSFVGDIVQSASNVFYNYEPLVFESEIPRFELIKTIFQCEYPTSYLDYINGFNGGDVHFMMRNLQAWNSCQLDRSMCYNQDFVNNLCQSYPVRMIKVVRMRVRELANAMQDDPSIKDWKIIYLFRDPRGTMASRTDLNWCINDRLCGNLKQFCKDTLDDYDEMEKLRIQDPRHHYTMKFEELSVDVNLAVKKLFAFLEMPVTNSVQTFLKAHTENEMKGPFSTFKKTKQVADAWRTKMPKSWIKNVTKACKPVLKRLGYKP